MKSEGIMEKHALVIDDEPKIRSLIAKILESQAWSVSTAASADEAFKMIEAKPWQLVFCDVVLGGPDGYEVLRRFSVECPKAHFILITGHGSAAGALEATATGAHDYLSKPFNIDEIIAISKKLSDRVFPPGGAVPRSTDDLISYGSDLGLIGKSPKFIECLKLVGRVAPTDLPVLISGSSGTGKEVVARAIHKRSSRADGPFVPVNCGAIPVELIESELFGHSRGSFTGADRERTGLWEEANGGTIFLDEITETGPLFQVKLLRALQEREIRRVGSNKNISVDVRVIAATNRKIEDEVDAGRFRQDLMYRLNVVSIELPSLGERKDDIIPLAEYFMSRNGSSGKRLSPDVVELLRRYGWDGNIRELENAVLGAIALADDVIYPEHLSEKIRRYAETPEKRISLADSLVHSTVRSEELVTLSKLEEKYVTAVLEQTGGNKQAASRILGIDRKTLVRIADRAKDEISS